MTLHEAMAALEQGANETFRKTWARHGVPPPLFGVSFEDLYKLQKKIGKDSGLARSLWITGNHDARILATLVVEPAKLSREELVAWVDAAHYRLLNDAVSRVTAASQHAIELADAWRRDRDEWVCSAGWTVVAALAMGEVATDDWLAARIDEIEHNLWATPNYGRHCMNSALIAIGGSRPALTKRAIAAAERIGEVEVDHGDTSCTTPDAAAYIRKMSARKRPAARKPARKKAAPRKAAPARKKAARRRAR
jgi:3-methyladenine DNA glycosylase AlkD